MKILFISLIFLCKYMEKLYEIYATLLNKNLLHVYQVTNDIFIIAEDVSNAYYLLHTSDYETGLRIDKVYDDKLYHFIIKTVIAQNWTLEEIMNGKVLKIDISDIFEQTNFMG